MKTAIATSGQLGPFLKRLRTERGLSQTALGQKIGLSQERVSKIENHPENVTFDQILTLLMALDAILTVEPREQAAASSRRTRAADKDAW
ncbi:MAG TPA: helix-turn-helix domain-containing protein [Noviherbaspirillum sp.]|jgi:HTH-type transcriptional regulator/antitoxin HipB|uniref:helix-turn-helix domain-containing protein n=1 Tax=Noviherbaspirillum sp. TaxID=1926288 RepID=UPI002F95AE14